MGCEHRDAANEQREQRHGDREGDTHRPRRPTGSSSEPVTSKGKRGKSALA
ncbi:MAG: hypothetical protein WD736_02465 [Chloroflexota bacterium]